jgi:hypothetical protein
MRSSFASLVALVIPLAIATGCPKQDELLGYGKTSDGPPSEGGSSDTAAPDPCAGIPQCGFACPAGKTNPIDSNKCIHKCECVPENQDAVGTGSTSDAAGTGSASDAATVNPGDLCAGIPQCQFPPCPNGTNPVDVNGCVHTCECTTGEGDAGPGKTTPDAGAPQLTWWYTCGDPLCRGYAGPSSTPLCTTEKAGDPCRGDVARCDPKDDCNRVLVCGSKDPRPAPGQGGCPISRAAFKQDIRYLEPAELARYGEELLRMKLATWRYKQDPSKERLGFMIDDNERSVAVDGRRDMVDLYGYTSLAVAAIQNQARELQALKAEMAEIKSALGRKGGVALRSRR